MPRFQQKKAQGSRTWLGARIRDQQVARQKAMARALRSTPRWTKKKLRVNWTALHLQRPRNLTSSTPKNCGLRKNVSSRSTARCWKGSRSRDGQGAGIRSCACSCPHCLPLLAPTAEAQKAAINAAVAAALAAKLTTKYSWFGCRNRSKISRYRSRSGEGPRNRGNLSAVDNLMIWALHHPK
jgi:hypothetical protein